MPETAVLDHEETAELVPVVERTAEEPAEAYEITEIVRLGRTAIDSTSSWVPEINWNADSSMGLLEGEVIKGSTLGLIHVAHDINCASILFCYDPEDDQNCKEHLLTAESLGALMRAISARVKQEFAAAA